MKRMIVKLGDIVCMIFIALVGMGAMKLFSMAQTPEQSIKIVCVAVGLIALTCTWFVLSAILDTLVSIRAALEGDGESRVLYKLREPDDSLEDVLRTQEAAETLRRSRTRH